MIYCATHRQTMKILLAKTNHFCIMQFHTGIFTGMNGIKIDPKKYKTDEDKMGIRLKKTVKFGPLNVNLSKSGLGFSVGTKKGYRFTWGSTGRKRHTFFIPGTGLSYVKESGTARPTKETLAQSQSFFSWHRIGKLIGITAIIVILALYILKQLGMEIDWQVVFNFVKETFFATK